MSEKQSISKLHILSLLYDLYNVHLDVSNKKKTQEIRILNLFLIIIFIIYFIGIYIYNWHPMESFWVSFKAR